MKKYLQILFATAIVFSGMKCVTHAATIYVSDGETIGGNTIAQRVYADTFDDMRKWGFDPTINTDNFYFQTYLFPIVGSLNTINSGSPYLDMPMTGCYDSNFKVTVSLRNDTGGDLRGIVESNTSSAPSISLSTTLQDNAVKPQSLYSANLWTESGFGAGDDDSRNAILYEFSEPVYGFGVWIGDVETRNDGNGILAEVRLLDEGGNLIISGGIVSNLTGGLNNTGLYVNCGGDTPNQSPSACGNETTRFVGFSDLGRQVKYMMIIVGDDDDLIDGGSVDGGDEHLSFIGPTVACPLADLTLSKQVSQPIIQSGDMLSYTINFANLLYGTAYHSQITDIFPTTYVHYLNSSIIVNQILLALSPIQSGNMLIWSGFDIGSQQTGQITITGIVMNNAAGISGWTNTAIIWASGEVFTGNNNGTAWVESMSYDLSIIKSVDKNTAQSGDIITYSIQYYLSGTNQSNIVIEDILPVGIEFSGIVLSNPASSHNNSSSLIFSGMSLTGGQTGYIIFEALVTTGLSGAILNNVAYIGIMTGTSLVMDTESNIGNNTGTATTIVSSLNDLDGIIYLDTDYNSGYNGEDTGISGVIVSLYYGSTLIATGITSSTGYYYFGNLLDGIYAVSYTHNTSYTSYASNTGTVDGNDNGEVMNTYNLVNINLGGGMHSINNNFGLIDTRYDLFIDKTVNVTQATIGDEIRYTITYGNNGPAPVHDVIVQDIFPNEVLYLDSADPMYDVTHGNIYAWNIGVLNAGQTGQIIITGTVLANTTGEESVVNTGIIGRGDLTGNLSFSGEYNTLNNISHTNGETVVHDLALTKMLAIGQSEFVTSGSQVTFTLTVHNQGSRSVDNISLLDYIPAGMILDDLDRLYIGSASGISYAKYTFPKPLNLMPGGSISVDITVKIDGSVGGKLTNLAEINENDGNIGGEDTDIDSTTDEDPSNDYFDTNTDDSLTDTEDDHDGASITIINNPIYTIQKTLLTANPRPGEVVVYRIDYEMIYQTPSTYFDIVIKDILGTGLIFSGFGEHYDTWLANHPGSLPGVGITGVFDIGGSDVYYYSLGNGTITGGHNSGYLIVEAIVDPSAQCGNLLVNSAGYSGPDGYEFDPSNWWAQDDVSYTIPCGGDVWIQKEALTGTYTSGSIVGRELIYGNNGPDTAYDVLITEQGGIGNTILSGSTYMIGTLNAGQTGSITVSGTVYGSSGTIVSNQVSIQTTTTDTVISNNTDIANIILNNNTPVSPHLNSIAGTMYVDTDKNSSYNNPDTGIGGITVLLYSGSLLIQTTSTSMTGYYYFGNLPDGNYAVSYHNISNYIPHSANTGTINNIPVGATSGVKYLTTITLNNGVNSIHNNFGLVQVTHNTPNYGGGAYIPVPYPTNPNITPINTTHESALEKPKNEVITLEDLLNQIPKKQPVVEKISYPDIKIMPKTGASIKKSMF